MGEVVEIDGVLLTPLRIISVRDGDVLHGMKRNELGYCGFGEAYFSKIQSGLIKGWKRHREMTLNLIVPSGAIRFVIYDDRPDSSTNGGYCSVILSNGNYQRLTVPPLVWLGFQGIHGGESMLLNIASIPHDPGEVEKREIHEIKFNWESSK